MISVFQIDKDASYPPDDMVHQYKYLGVAPQSEQRRRHSAGRDASGFRMENSIVPSGRSYP